MDHILKGTNKGKTGSSLFSGISKTTGEGERENRKSWVCQFSAAKEEWGRKAVIAACPCLHPCPHFSEAAVTSHMRPFPVPSSCDELGVVTVLSCLLVRLWGLKGAQQLKDPGSWYFLLVQGWLHCSSARHQAFFLCKTAAWNIMPKATLNNSCVHSIVQKKGLINARVVL